MADPISYLRQLVHQWFRQRFIDPTREWPRRQIASLEFNAPEHTLNGVALDSPISQARTFGRADRTHGGRNDPDLDYLSLGLQLDCFDGLVIGFRFIMDPASRMISHERDFRSARVRFAMLNGSQHVLSRSTSEEEILALFGSPFETGPVLKDRVHSFLVAGNSVDTYHSTGSGTLTEMTVHRATEG